MNNNTLINNILNEVKGYYNNKSNYLNEEDYSIEDSHIMGMDYDNIPDMIWDALYNGKIDKNDTSVTVHTNVGDFNIFNDGTAEESNSGREIELPEFITDRIRQYLSYDNTVAETVNRVVCKVLNESLYEVEPTEEQPQQEQTDNRFLLDNFKKAYFDRNIDKKAEGVGDDYVEIWVDADIQANVTFDYHVNEYHEISSDYYNPGELVFDSDITANSIIICDGENNEEEFDDPEAVELAQQILDDYKDYIDDAYIDEHSPDDYADSGYDPDTAYDDRY